MLLHKIIISFILIVLIKNNCISQLQATFTKTLNTNCNGSDCFYSGPSILINELMISPVNGDGSICGLSNGDAAKGEWIELYNPNLCEPIDISCYYLGNNTSEGNGGFVIPSGTIIPANGFCLIRGVNSPAPPANLLVQNGGKLIDIVIPALITDPGVCSGGTRIWFPNSGGWFAFYDQNGIPQDAVSWGGNAADLNSAPCIPALTGCTAPSNLASYNAIPAERKNYISAVNASDHLGLSLQRGVDGQAWAGPGNSTQGDCNGIPFQNNSSSCTGSATITVTGGVSPYTYSWDDSQAQITQTATGLCDGTYTVIVTDNVGATQSFTVEIINFVPTATISTANTYCINGIEGIINVTPIATTLQTGVISGAGVLNDLFYPSISNSGSHEIKYVFEDEFGCIDSALTTVFVTETISPNFTFTASCLLDVELISLANNQNYAYKWYLENQEIGTGQTLKSDDIGVGTHEIKLIITDNYGCSFDTLSSIEISEGIKDEDLINPNVITPNDDGLNDSFILPSMLIDCLNIEINILNRWGQKVYTMNNKNTSFGGFSENGEKLSEGVYFFTVDSDVINCEDEKYKSFCSGNITIIR